MRVELTQVHWLDEDGELTLAELAELSGLAPLQLQELVNAGAIAPRDIGARPWRFRTGTIATVRTAVRLRDDFDLDTRGLALALDLLERIHALEAQLRALRAKTPRR